MLFSKDFFQKLASKKILVVGDVMLDIYYRGSSKRISPEAPVPIVDVDRIEKKPGGASNVALNLKALGAKTCLIGVIGDDLRGKELQDLLDEEAIDHLLLKLWHKTITKSRILVKGQQMLRFDIGQGQSTEQPVLDLFAKEIIHYDAVIFSDYGKGTLSCVKEMIAIAKSFGKLSFVDPKGIDFTRYQGANIITPNFNEFSQVVGKCDQENEVWQKGCQLAQDLELDYLVLTRSEKGISILDAKGYKEDFPACVQEVFDVTGAGDTVIATIAAAMTMGCKIETCAQLANQSAGIVVGKLGSATASIQEILDLGAQALPPHILFAAHEHQKAYEFVKARRQKGQKIVFTNGCFDLLHLGHIRYLQKASTLGDLLIVGLNSDASVKKLKGPQRPIKAEFERAQLLLALDCVHAVVIFESSTPLALIKKLRPDVLVKGGDYSIKDIAGSKEVIADGGEVRLIEFLPSFSTTGVIEQIKKLD